VGLCGVVVWHAGGFAAGSTAAAYQGFTLYVGPSVGPTATYRVERLVRYVTRPPLATSRLHRLRDGTVLYRFKRPWKDGTHAVRLTPLAFVERLAALIPSPGRHLLTYHGVLAAHAALRPRIVPSGPASPSCAHPPQSKPGSLSREGTEEGEGLAKGAAGHRPTYYPWSYLLYRVFGIQVWVCPRCGGPRRMVAWITDPLVIARMVDHRARGSP